MVLARLTAGTRFRLTEAPEVSGTLVKVNEGSATVELDGRPQVCDFETFDHRWVRIEKSGKRRTTICKMVDVQPQERRAVE